MTAGNRNERIPMIKPTGRALANARPDTRMLPALRGEDTQIRFYIVYFVL